MAKVETDTRRIRARLEAEGWIARSGAKHDLYTNPADPQKLIPVPRHRELTPLTARSIAKAAGWI
jgi:predicted RNA binding protein YcfA (HicA-like mRNA interferase family)